MSILEPVQRFWQKRDTLGKLIIVLGTIAIVYFAVVPKPRDVPTRQDWADPNSTILIEDVARVSNTITKPQLQAFVRVTRASGYRCDSISGATPFLIGYGFSLHCNGWRYSYEIEDKGGNWIVTVD